MIYILKTKKNDFESSMKIKNLGSLCMILFNILVINDEDLDSIDIIKEEEHVHNKNN